MKLTHIFEAGTGFRILDTTERSQTGLLTLETGAATGDKPSRHEDSDQTLTVLEGELTAEVGEEKSVMKKGDAVLVPARTPHRFINTGKSRATTFSVYARPAFPPRQKERVTGLRRASHSTDRYHMRLQPSRRSSSPHDNISIGQALVYGVVAGLVATGIKTVCELIAPPRPPGVESPLGNVINAASVEMTGEPMRQSLKSFAEPAVHFGFGAVTAGIYVVVSERFPILRAGCGSLFGFLFWLGLHETALPVCGFSPSPAAMSLWEQGNELVSHVAYGVTVELVRRGLVRKLA